MNIIEDIFVFSLLIFTVVAHNATENPVIAGYNPGLSGMEYINPADCLNEELRQHSFLSNSLECARTCEAGGTRTCYYKFIIERYPVNGQACNLCMPNTTNTLCPNCQCVPGDGTQRMAITVNRMIPGPTIQVCKGDYVVVDVLNMLKSDSVTIHWHGVFQQGSPHHDGVPHLTQCPILIQNTFRYQFFADNSGTHLWHAHTAMQKMDGLFGSFIVREPTYEEPYAQLYDFDLANHVIVVNDWFKEESTSRIPGSRESSKHTAEAFLINGKGRFIDSIGTSTSIPFEVITVDANNRYRFRFINSFCTICAAQLMIEGHKLTVIASDGQAIKPIEVDSIVSLAGERYDFVINANQTPGAYWIQVRGLDECAPKRVHQLAILQYVKARNTPKLEEPTHDNPLPSIHALDLSANGCDKSHPDKICGGELKHALSIDPGILKMKPDMKLELPIGMYRYAEGEAFQPNTYRNFLVPSMNWTVIQMLNKISTISPSVPALSQLEDIPSDQFCNADNMPPHCSSKPVCECTHLVKLPLNAVVEIVLIDEFNTEHVRHPFHLHGFAFHVVGMGQPFGPFTETGSKMTLDYFRQLDAANQIERNLISPPGKDTIAVPNNGYAIIRFRANNPGYWLLHCHQIFHVLAGMEVIFQVGEPTDMPKTPKDFPRCGDFKPKIEASDFDQPRFKLKRNVQGIRQCAFKAIREIRPNRDPIQPPFK